MSTVNLPPVVNDQGNINLHKDEGAAIPITVQDDTGAEINASAIPLFFISGSFRKALLDDPSNLEGRIVEITPDDLALIPHGADFRVADETDPDMPVNKWEGRIYKRG